MAGVETRRLALFVLMFTMEFLLWFDLESMRRAKPTQAARFYGLIALSYTACARHDRYVL
ncbi:MAG: hypothetical protein CL802_15205 [Citromicrobium sp.]|nr:hypothetical protein WG75_08020 [Citromicrobium sp. WPS32]MAY78883.1 hypothetical protein [Citromicrobium sp.]